MPEEKTPSQLEQEARKMREEAAKKRVKLRQPPFD